MFVAIADSDFIQGQEGPLSPITWASWKLQRVARSSLAAEVQAASDTQEELEYVRLSLYDFILDEVNDLRMANECISTIPGILILDCKSLYDSVNRSESSALGMKDKRTAIEALALRSAVMATNTSLKWSHSEAQLADVLTKLSGPGLKFFLQFLRRGKWRLVLDPRFISSKKRALQGLKIFDDPEMEPLPEVGTCPPRQIQGISR